eukprot:4608948-Ditylum_brightwellii.AAC.1
MQNVEKHQYFDDDQHCGRNGRTASDIVLGKCFLFDTFHFQHTNIACTDCDVKVYYNRILPLAFGIAPIANYFGLFGPVYGIGQGATDSPPGWMCIVDVGLKFYEQLTKGCTMTDPTKSIIQKDNS